MPPSSRASTPAATLFLVGFGVGVQVGLMIWVAWQWVQVAANWWMTLSQLRQNVMVFVISLGLLVFGKRKWARLRPACAAHGLKLCLVVELVPAALHQAAAVRADAQTGFTGVLAWAALRSRPM